MELPFPGKRYQFRQSEKMFYVGNKKQHFMLRHTTAFMQLCGIFLRIKRMNEQFIALYESD